jgi:hypothetical protein
MAMRTHEKERTMAKDEQAMESTHVGEPLTATEEFNLALEWLQYSRGTAQVLADHLHEADEINIRDTALAVEAVATMVREGASRIARAYSALHWEYAVCSGVSPR